MMLLLSVLVVVVELSLLLLLLFCCLPCRCFYAVRVVRVSATVLCVRLSRISVSVSHLYPFPIALPAVFPPPACPGGVTEKAMAVYGRDTVGNKRSWEAAMTAAGTIFSPTQNSVTLRATGVGRCTAHTRLCGVFWRTRCVGCCRTRRSERPTRRYSHRCFGRPLPCHCCRCRLLLLCRERQSTVIPVVPHQFLTSTTRSAVIVSGSTTDYTDGIFPQSTISRSVPQGTAIVHSAILHPAGCSNLSCAFGCPPQERCWRPWTGCSMGRPTTLSALLDRRATTREWSCTAWAPSPTAFASSTTWPLRPSTPTTTGEEACMWLALPFDDFGFDVEKGRFLGKRLCHKASWRHLKTTMLVDSARWAKTIVVPFLGAAGTPRTCATAFPATLGTPAAHGLHPFRPRSFNTQIQLSNPGLHP